MVLRTFLRTGMGSMSDGKEPIIGPGMSRKIYFNGSPPTTESINFFILVDSETGEETLIGGGDTTVINPTFCFTYNDKEYILAGDSVHFSEIQDPEKWLDPEAVGAGYVRLSNHYAAPEDLVAAVPFQGQLAFMSRSMVQIWSVAADPANWSLVQLLPNIGVIAKASVQAKGDLDAFFLSDTGVRNLRAREQSLNATVQDLGSPIDSIIQEKILAYPNDAPNACSIIEPSTGQYWLFLKDTIYVLSYFESSRVIAWSTFTPVDNAGDSFTPTKFCVWRGKVYVRAGNSVLTYGGSTGLVYDNTPCVAELPWADLKTPNVEKTGESIQAAFTGGWKVSMGMDAQGEELHEVYNDVRVTFGLGQIPAPGVGHHFKARMESTTARQSRFSSLVFTYQGGDQK